MYGKTRSGVALPPVLGNDGVLLTSDSGGKYYDLVSRGNVFSLVLTAWTTTTAAGNLIAAAAAAVSQFALWNPTGSGKNMALLKFATWPISGTWGIPSLFHSYMSTNPTIANSALTPVTCNNVGRSADTVAGYHASAAGTALTGCSALKVIRSANLYITAGTLSALAGVGYVDVCDGDIVIPPGFGWAPTWAAAGTTTLGGYSVTWAEIDI
ncbi:MAG: hypothetical protein ABIJ57_09415 [Pseudomonadota bacterium]|uniref:Uncharacterized protein n=1 Tax=viral metagenome TaxID=1070528 RepID=A0A6M3J833_9ZZZZ